MTSVAFGGDLIEVDPGLAAAELWEASYDFSHAGEALPSLGASAQHFIEAVIEGADDLKVIGPTIRKVHLSSRRAS
jgi:hypothetical protein